MTRAASISAPVRLAQARFGNTRRTRFLPVLSFLSRLFGKGDDLAPFRPLYTAVVAKARDPFWYRDGRVPDTIDGRFDMVAAVLSLVLLRLEAEGAAAREAGARVTELFVDDMDGQLRQIGFGDIVVGKHVGGLMGALGGRLTAFRAALADPAALEAAVARNIFRDAPPAPELVGRVAARLKVFADALAATSFDRLIAGELP
jgi:cytochrome b pre-mRNA-processing protein 3